MLGEAPCRNVSRQPPLTTQSSSCPAARQGSLQTQVPGKGRGGAVPAVPHEVTFWESHFIPRHGRVSCGSHTLAEVGSSRFDIQARPWSCGAPANLIALFVTGAFCPPSSSGRGNPLPKAQGNPGQGPHHSLVILVLDAQSSPLDQSDFPACPGNCPSRGCLCSDPAGGPCPVTAVAPSQAHRGLGVRDSPSRSTES